MNYLVVDENYSQALFYYQEAVKQGDPQSAYNLSGAFKTSDPNNSLDYLGQEIDLERSRRYALISENR